MKHIFKTTLGLMALFGLLMAGCKNSPTSSKSNTPPTITLPSSNFSVGNAADTTVSITVHADAGIKSITATASSGTVTVKNVQGVGSTDGSANIEYKAPSSDGTDTVTVKVTDSSNQTADSKIDFSVSSSNNSQISIQ